MLQLNLKMIITLNPTTITLKDVATVFKMPAEEIKEMLMQVALPKANVGWQFM